MALNKELLLKVMEEIEKFPETHFQAAWFKPLDEPVPGPNGELCKTAFCFAGHAAVMSGAAMPIVPPGDAVRPYEMTWYINPTTLESVLLDTYGDEQPPDDTLPVERFAKDVLGLDSDTAGCLFTARNTRALLRAMVEHVIEHGTITSNQRYNLKMDLHEVGYQRTHAY